MYDRNGDEVSAADVLDPEELASLRTHDGAFRQARPQILPVVDEFGEDREGYFHGAPTYGEAS